MIIYDVLSELKSRELYISSPVYAGALSRPAVVVPIILDAVERTKETGVMWQLSTSQIADLFKIGDPAGLYVTLVLLEQEGVLNKTKVGREVVYSPVIEDRVGVRCIDTASKAGKLNILQSPRSLVTRTECDAIIRTFDADVSGGTRGFTLLSYDYDAFVGKTKDLRLFTYFTEDRMDPTLIMTWFASLGIKNIPRELSIDNAEDFWRTATHDFFVDHGAFNPAALPPVPWRSLDAKIVHPSTSPDLRTSKVHTEMRKLIDPDAYKERWNQDQIKFAPWPAEKIPRKPVENPTSEDVRLLKKLEAFIPPSENPFEKPDTQADLVAKRLVGSTATPKIAENRVVKTKIIRHDSEDAPRTRVMVNESEPMTQRIKIPANVVPQAPNTQTVTEKLREHLSAQRQVTQAQPPAQTTVQSVKRDVDITSSFEVMNDIVRSNLDPKVKNLVIQYLIKGGLNEPTI